jgi:molecular chaperone DnaK (HSP70)
MKLAIDFGTTNSVVARWIEGATPQNGENRESVQLVTLPGLSTLPAGEQALVIPSLVYVHDGAAARLSVGQSVLDQGLDLRHDKHLYRNFKRGIVVTPAPEPREIDGVLWGDRDAGTHFVRSVLSAIREQYTEEMAEIEQLILTAPVASFEGYLAWLNSAIDPDIVGPEKIRIVDESTAAALGYAVTEPGAVVLVFDFGGGTLDLSLVQLPEEREKTGGFLQRLLRGGAERHTAKIIAKTGRILGGSDIDQWLLAEVLRRIDLTPGDLGNDYAPLLARCEQAKIALSSVEVTTIGFEVAGRSYEVTVSRAELESLLEANGFYTALRRIVDKVMHVAHQRGIFKEDINYVLMVGGISLMPSVQKTLRQYFSNMAVRADKPFTAIAEGALLVAAGYGLDDYLVHSYGLRHLNPQTGLHEYDEIIPMGSRYPTSEPVEVLLGAAHEDQDSVEFVVGEIDTEAVTMVEVKYENGQAVFVAQADSTAQDSQQIVPLNEGTDAIARLKPAGTPGKDRLKAAFTVDDRRQLRITVNDLKTGKHLLQNAVVATLR